MKIETMTLSQKIVVFGTVIAFLIAGIAQAAPGGVNTTVRYTGTISDASGIVIPEGEYRLNLVIYDDPFGGVELYREERNNFTDYSGAGGTICPQQEIIDGVFDVMIGECNPLDPAILNNTSLYVELQLGLSDLPGDESVYEEIFSPRREIGSTFSAISATQLVSQEGGNLSTLGISSGNLIFDTDGVTGGNLGIGSTSPVRRLTLGDTGVGIDDVGTDMAFFTNNLERVRITSAGNIGINTDTPTVSLDISATDAIRIPVGTEAQRPSIAGTGMMRFNTDSERLEVYDGVNWQVLSIAPSSIISASIEEDFYRANENAFGKGLLGVAQGSGSIASIAGTTDHPGVVALRDSTTVNGGYTVATEPNAFLLSGRETFEIIFQARSTRAGIRGHMGFFDVLTLADPVDCVCYVITSNGTNISFSARTRANNTATNSASPYTLTPNTWYRATITLNDDATSAQFTLFSESGTELWTDTQTNIPRTTGRETGAGVAAFENSIDAAADIMWVDYMQINTNRRITR